MNRCWPMWALVSGLFLAVQPLRAEPVVRPIVVSSADRKAGTVIVQFLSGGHVDPRGRGLAVIDENQAQHRYRILANNPEGWTTLAVDVRGSWGQLFLKYGRIALPGARRDDTVPASLVLRTYAIGKGPLPRLEDLSREIPVIHPLGTALVQNISFGHNPFGEDTYFVTYLEGLLAIDEARTLALFSANDDAAQVAIDGTVIIHHPAASIESSSERLAEQARPISLDSGTYRLSYLHVQTDGGTLAVLGYMTDGRAVPLPAEMFVHHPTVELGQARSSGSRPVVGFDARQLDQIAHDRYIYTRFELNAIAPAPADTYYRWRFRDLGQDTTAETAKLEHVFVGPAPSWQVQLELVGEKGLVVGRATSALRPGVFTNCDSIGNEELLAKYARAIAGHDYAKTSYQVMEALYGLVAATERPQLIAPLAEPFLQRFGNRGGEIFDRMKYTLASHLAGSDPERAAEKFGEVARGAADSWLRACALAEQLDLLIFRIGDAKRAMTVRVASSRPRTDRERALLRARLGDVHRLSGDIEKTRQAYLSAQQISTRKMDPRRAAVLDQAYRQTALSYLRQKRWPALRDILFQWEADFPLARLAKDLPLITGRYFQAIGNDARAAQEFKAVLEMNPLHPSRPEITFRLAQSLASTGQKAQAGQLIEELARKYPKSPFAGRPLP